MVNDPFTTLMRDLAEPLCYRLWLTSIGKHKMSIPYVADRQTVVDANALITAFGDDAGFEAATRAEDSRDRGNVIAFCRWRQIERLIAVLAGPEATGTVH